MLGEVARTPSMQLSRIGHTHARKIEEDLRSPSDAEDEDHEGDEDDDRQGAEEVEIRREHVADPGEQADGDARRDADHHRGDDREEVIAEAERDVACHGAARRPFAERTDDPRQRRPERRFG